MILLPEVIKSIFWHIYHLYLIQTGLSIMKMTILGKRTPYISIVYTSLKSIRLQEIQGTQYTMKLQTIVLCVERLDTPFMNVIFLKTTTS